METLVTKKVSIVLSLIFVNYGSTANGLQKRPHEMFMRFGIRSVSMDEIASQLGISKKNDLPVFYG